VTFEWAYKDKKRASVYPVGDARNVTAKMHAKAAARRQVDSASRSRAPTTAAGNTGGRSTFRLTHEFHR